MGGTRSIHGPHSLESGGHLQYPGFIVPASDDLQSSARSFSEISRTTRHGLPTAKTPSGTSRVTTLPAPMTERDPMLTPGRTSTAAPIQTSEPIVIGLPYSSFRRSAALNG